MAIRITRAGVGLTVGIIILALVVLGGLYLVRERGEQARREEAIQVAQENLESQSQDGGALNPAPQESTTTDQGASGGQEGDSDALPTGGATGAPEQLPATGPSDVLTPFALALLTFAVGSYVASRGALSRQQ